MLRAHNLEERGDSKEGGEIEIGGKNQLTHLTIRKISIEEGKARASTIPRAFLFT